MPRNRNPVRPQEWKICIPADLSARVDLLLWDPVLNKPKYGSRAAIITQLLTRWCDEEEASLPTYEEPS